MTTFNKNTDGYPKIAEQIRKNKLGVVIVLGAIAVIAGSFFLKRTTDKKVDQRVEESYTLKNDALPLQSPDVMRPGVSVAVSDDKKVEQVSAEVIAAQATIVHEKQQQLQQRLSAPMMLFAGDTKENTESSAQDDHPDSNPNTQFMQNASKAGVQTATAVALGSLGSIITAGNFIHAILESATNSDLPGSLRAIVSDPVYAEDGSRILIPRGSRLIGEYKSGMMQGQSRIFIVWQRLISPEGISIQLGSGGVDSLGVAGIGADSIDRHFWGRFGTASLLSMIGTGAATFGVSGGDQNNSASSYRTAISNSFSQSANQSLQQDGMIAPTLKTMQGKPIMVFVAKDLQFDDVMKSTKSSISIF